MELNVTQENLSRALSFVGRVASSKTQLPILSNILLRTDGKRLLVAATDLEIASTQLIGAKITTPGSITVPARLVSDFVASLPKGTVELKAEGTHLHISSGGYKSVIHGAEADDFPELPVIDEAEAVQYEINTDDFSRAVSQTVITSSNDTTRPVLTGVYWHSHEGALYLAATDGYRLAERRLVETKSEISVIIPTSSLQEVLRSIHDDIQEVTVLIDEGQVRFRAGDAEITSRLIDGNFPDYRQLIPTSTDNTAKVSKQELVRITKIAGLFARDAGGSVVVAVDETTNKMSIRSIASEYGQNTSEVDASVTGEGEITLNSRYISDALSVTDGDTISFGFSGKLSPCVIRAETKDANYTHIVMPLKS